MYVGPWQEYELMKVLGDLHDQRSTNRERGSDAVAYPDQVLHRTTTTPRHSTLDASTPRNAWHLTEEVGGVVSSHAGPSASVAESVSRYASYPRHDFSDEDGGYTGGHVSYPSHSRLQHSPDSAATWASAGRRSFPEARQAAARLRAMQLSLSVRVNVDALGERASRRMCRRVLLQHAPEESREEEDEEEMEMDKEDGVVRTSRRFHTRMNGGKGGDSRRCEAAEAESQRRRREHMCALYAAEGEERSACVGASRRDCRASSSDGFDCRRHITSGGSVDDGNHPSLLCVHASLPRENDTTARYETRMHAFAPAFANVVGSSSVTSSTVLNGQIGVGVPWDSVILSGRPKDASAVHASQSPLWAHNADDKEGRVRTAHTDTKDSFVVEVSVAHDGGDGSAVCAATHAPEAAMDDVGALLSWAEDLNIDAIDAM